MSRSVGCTHGKSAPESLLDTLHDAQAGMGRHKCPVCAYDLARTTSLPDKIQAAGLLELERCRAGREAPAAILAVLPDSQAGVGRHKCVVCAYAAGLEGRQQDALIYPDDVQDLGTFPEGAVQRTTVNSYERSPEARRRCIDRHGYACSACGRTLESIYGDAAREFIHVHHLRALSDIGAEYQVDPVQDLRPICPNCHAIIHRRQPPYSIEEVRGMLKTRS